IEDIDRVDFRPGKRVFKVRSKHNYAEIQVDAVSGSVLSVASRPSDLLEAVHDGSYYAGWMHAALMPVAGGGLIFVSLSGLYLWLSSWMRKRRHKKN
ncbi:MAG: PepSY domain-containing protein, partial [Planctomycetota bacterium]